MPTTHESETDAIRIVKLRRSLKSGEAREVRERAGLSQADVARALGVHEMTLGGWERGQKVPRSTTALAYARLLDELREVSA